MEDGDFFLRFLAFIVIFEFRRHVDIVAQKQVGSGGAKGAHNVA